VVFERCFENTNEGQIVNRFSNEVGHHIWLQGPFNHLSREWKANYIVAVFCQFFKNYIFKPSMY
jgi:hypothetical protein